MRSLLAPTAGYLLAALLAATAARAADVAYMPVNHQRLVQLSPAEVWSRVHDFLQDQGFEVVREDQASGMIDSRRQGPKTGAFAGLADCPTKLFWSPQHEVADLNIAIKPATDGARITVNAAFLQVGKPGKKGTADLACFSQGVLERAVMDVAAGQPMEAAVIPH
jgi:hypothetical protein